MLGRLSKFLEDRRMRQHLEKVAGRIMTKENFMDHAMKYHAFIGGYRPFHDIGIVYEPDAPLKKVDAMVLGLLLIGMAEVNPFGSDTVNGLLEFSKSCYIGGACTMTEDQIQEAGVESSKFASMLSIYENHESIVRAAPEVMESICGLLGCVDTYKKATDAWEQFNKDRSVPKKLLWVGMNDKK